VRCWCLCLITALNHVSRICGFYIMQQQNLVNYYPAGVGLLSVACAVTIDKHRAPVAMAVCVLGALASVGAYLQDNRLGTLMKIAEKPLSKLQVRLAVKLPCESLKIQEEADSYHWHGPSGEDRSGRYIAVALVFIWAPSTPQWLPDLANGQPPWVTAVTGPGAPGRSARNACNRAPACREDSWFPGAKSRSCLVRAHTARKTSKGMRPSQFRRSGSLASGWAVSLVTEATQAAVSGARRRGLVHKESTPKPRSHRPVRVAWC